MNKAESDEFLDAVEGDDSEDGEREATFEVTKEELSIIRAELASEFPEDYQSLSDDYVLSVASKPYSKDPTVRRPLDYSMGKLKGVMKWRTDKAIGLTDMLTLAEGPSTATEAVEDPDRYTKAKALATSMNYASMYWHGLDKKGRPILWIRTDRMVSALNAFILLFWNYYLIPFLLLDVTWCMFPFVISFAFISHLYYIK
jgi:hypothetical protein